MWQIMQMMENTNKDVIKKACTTNSTGTSDNEGVNLKRNNPTIETKRSEHVKLYNWAGRKVKVNKIKVKMCFTY